MARKKAASDKTKEPPPQGPSSLISKLMQVLAVSAAAIRRREPDPDGLQPPGKRSGRGSESIEPYLSHDRGTRPGPLE